MSAAPLQYDDGTIRRVLSETKTIAIVGASAKEIRPSYFVLKYLLAKGFRVVPINPGLAGQEILGQTVYARLADVPEPIDMVDIFRASDAVPGIVEEALSLDPLPKVIWMQLSVRHDAAAAKAEAAGLTVIMDRCPKIEFARLSGEIGWNGVNSRVLSSKKPRMGSGYQSLGLNPRR
ncbi:CoA-binding protein [Jiella sp. M17.18]|uniref:CoA-binding protein n=1 Tax=Jiella sp. M17.18 TaxID=3234247 RepID=UPI0034DEBD3B